ncbi:MAG: hypothetical protein IJA72_00995 [Clostridia bacterium]|nr:hypothetical protein [Clostridia bacterium]
MQKKKLNYVYCAIQLILFGLLIMFVCTHFCGVTATEPFRESKFNILNCTYCLLFSFLPFILRRWNIHSTRTLQVYFLIAIIVHFIGGGTLHFYRDVWWFSFLVHLINSFLIATIIYGMLLRHCRNQSKFFMFIATVAFTALVGVLWEVCEYAIDGLSGKNMQRFNNSVTNEPFIGRKALQDTMIDLMMDTLGGVLAGLYFAFTNIKGVPLYKFLELKYVKSDNSIAYSEDYVLNEQLQQAQNEKRALKIVAKNEKRKAKIDRAKCKRAYKQEKLRLNKEQKINNKQNKIENKTIKNANKKIKKTTQTKPAKEDSAE